MLNIKTLNHIAETGLRAFDPSLYCINSPNAAVDALILRSFNLHDGLSQPLLQSLKVVGRAGAGTNNIPVDLLTARGIPVLNTPGANANAVKELVIAAMLIASRNLLPAWNYLNQLPKEHPNLKTEVEETKKRFAGFELIGKTLGLIGLGNIGAQVANAAHNLGMKVMGYDPSMTVQSAWMLHPSVQKAEKIEEVLINADFLSLHVPLNETTHSLIHDSCFQLMKKGVVLLNFSRKEIVHSDALSRALTEENPLRYYLCDFPDNRFLHHPKVITFPHLGASTKEAEENCALMIVQQVRDFLEQGHIKNSVNFPDVTMPKTKGYRIAITNQNIPNMVAQLSSILSKSGINIIDMINKSRKGIAYNLLDLSHPIDHTILNTLLKVPGIINARNIPERTLL